MQQPLNHKGINLAPTLYKIYSSVLNNRLSEWFYANIDEQMASGREALLTIYQLSHQLL